MNVNANVLKRFVIYMAILTFVMFTIWGFVRSFMDRPLGDYETEVCDIRLKDKKYEEALKDYVKALGIDHEAVAGPGLGTIILNYKFKSSSVKERALYLNEQLQLPEDERVLSIKELDEGQVMHKPGKL